MEAVWNDVKAAIKERIPGHSYRMWIEPIKFYQTENGNLVLTCPNFFSRKRVQENYGSIINSEMSKALGKDCGVTIVVSSDNGGKKPQAQSLVQLALPNVQIRPHSGRLLRREFTFEHFVVSGNNDFAYSASLALASRKDTLQPSLFLLSQTGMGKSHLTQAIGHQILSQFPDERVFYMTAEDFSNEMVQAFRHDAIDKFKKSTRA